MLEVGRRIKQSVFLLTFACLTGCAEGDLGRIKSSLVIDDIHAWVGADAVGSVGIPPSRFGLTDPERELRDLAYPLIEPPYDRQRWYSILGEYGLARVRKLPFDQAAYLRHLMARPARSAASRYALLLEDIRNDLVRIEPFFRTAERVADLDGKRAQSLPYVTALSREELADAQSRMAENQLVTGWVQHSLRLRVDSYRYALEHLVIAFPAQEAVECERTLNRLALQIDAIPGVAVQQVERRHISK